MTAQDFDQALVGAASVENNAGSEKQLEVMAARLHHLLAPLETQKVIELDAKENYLVMRLLGHSTFDSGKAEIKLEVVPLLRAIGKTVSQTTYGIFVAGHTDNVPIRSKTYKSNLELSAARAASVVDFFVGEGFVSSDRIATMGFGEHRPLVPNDSSANRERNRRIEIILASTYAPPDETAPASPLLPFLPSPVAPRQ